MKKFSPVVLFFALTTLILSSCGDSAPKDYTSEVDEGTIQNYTYHSPTLGWTMKYPNDWLITRKASLKAFDERSKQTIEDTVSDMSGIKRLLAFQKNFNNNFQSTMEAFSGKTTQDYYAAIYSIHEMIYNNYLDQRTPVDTATVNVSVGKHKFDGFEIHLFDKKGKNFGNQLLLTSLIKSQFVSVTIAYDNKEDREKMLKLFKESKFE